MKVLFNKLINKFTDTQFGSKANNKSEVQKPTQNQSSNQNIINTPNNTPLKSSNNLQPSNVSPSNASLKTPQNTPNNINNNQKVDQIVIVNERQVENKLKGYYYQKHIDDIKKLKISEPIVYQRQKMKVNFDIDILDYLFNDMTQIFKMKSNLVEENKNELIKKINETYDLVNILSDFNKNSDEILNKYMKQKKIMDNVEMMEIFIKTLSQEVDDLLLDITKFEVKMKKEMEEESKKDK